MRVVVVGLMHLPDSIIYFILAGKQFWDPSRVLIICFLTAYSFLAWISDDGLNGQRVKGENERTSPSALINSCSSSASAERQEEESITLSPLSSCSSLPDPISDPLARHTFSFHYLSTQVMENNRKPVRLTDVCVRVERPMMEHNALGHKMHFSLRFH